MRRHVLAACCVVLLVASAHADGLSRPPGLTDPNPSGTATPPGTAKSRGKKSPAFAVALTITTALAGYAILASDPKNDNLALVGLAAMYVGPSTGQWYAGRIGAPGLVTRLGAGWMFVHGLGIRDDHELNDCLGVDDASECDAILDHADREMERGEKWMQVGAALWLVSSLVDVALSHRAAVKHNERSVAITPLLTKDSATVTLGMAF